MSPPCGLETALRKAGAETEDHNSLTGHTEAVVRYVLLRFCFSNGDGPVRVDFPFYGSNSWAYTRLGHITDKSAADLEELLGNGDVTITISIT